MAVAATPAPVTAASAPAPAAAPASAPPVGGAANLARHSSADSRSVHGTPTRRHGHREQAAPGDRATATDVESKGNGAHAGRQTPGNAGGGHHGNKPGGPRGGQHALGPDVPGAPAPGSGPNEPGRHARPGKPRTGAPSAPLPTATAVTPHAPGLPWAQPGGHGHGDGSAPHASGHR
jgi:hypothetical protein